MPNNCKSPEMCLLSETRIPCAICPNAKEKADDRLALTPCSRLLPPPMQTAMVFAARYTHHRNTGGTLAVCRALAGCWDQLDERTQKQIIEESHEATYNKDDWAQFMGDNPSANVESIHPETKP